jgi:hypothetical protein
MSIPLWIADSDTKSSTVTACASAFNLTAAATSNKSVSALPTFVSHN